MSFAWLEAKARNVFSQFGEDGVIDAIFRTIRPANQWCFECGAADGIFMSNTRRLIRHEWHAILVEADHDNFRRLHANCQKYPRAKLVCEKAEALDPLLAKMGAPIDIDLVVIDIDGQDYYMLNSLLHYRPQVVVVEYDPTCDPEFIPDLDGEGQAGLEAMRRLAAAKFYTAVFRTWSNLILVKQPLDQLLDMESEAKP